MPRGDRTGPFGAGPMSGRRAGFCSGFPVAGFMNSPFGFGGFGFRGRGRGWRHMFWATGMPGWARGFHPGFSPLFNPEASSHWSGNFWPEDTQSIPEKAKKDQAKLLKKQIEILEEDLKELNTRLKELEEIDEEESK